MQTIDVRPRRRVAPLAPGDRRAALIEATVPLLRIHGLAVSTRQIAEAAGVAEGTIFRVFPDKASLVLAAAMRAMDPQPLVDALHAIAPDVPLRERLNLAADIMMRRMADSGPLLAIARELTMGRRDPAATDVGDNGRPAADPRKVVVEMHVMHARICTAIAEVIEPYRDHLRSSPATAARLLLSTLVASSGFVFGEAETATSDEIVAVLLDGLLIQQPPTAPAQQPPTAPVRQAPTTREFPC